MKQIMYDTVSQTIVIGVPDIVLLCSFLNPHQSMGKEGGGAPGGVKLAKSFRNFT